MATRRKPAASPRQTSVTPEHDDSAAVTEYLNSLKHPLKPVVEAIRRTILAADPAITEGIKWNSPSFYRDGWFATVNLRPKPGVLVVLHHGAKSPAGAGLRDTIDDPAHLLTWPSKDRALAAFASAEEFSARRESFQNVIRQWVQHQTDLVGRAIRPARPEKLRR